MVRNELNKNMRILKINKYIKLVRVSQILASLKQNKKTDGEKRSLFHKWDKFSVSSNDAKEMTLLPF